MYFIVSCITLKFKITLRWFNFRNDFHRIWLSNWLIIILLRIGIVSPVLGWSIEFKLWIKSTSKKSFLNKYRKNLNFIGRLYSLIHKLWFLNILSDAYHPYLSLRNIQFRYPIDWRIVICIPSNIVRIRVFQR